MRRLDILIIALFVFGVASVVLAPESPYARSALCELITFCPSFDPTGFWKKLAYDLGMGSLMTILFYALLVRIPEEQKKRRLRKNLERHYRMFKEDSIALFVGAADGSYSPEHVRTLLDQGLFREYFKVEIGDRQDRWGLAISNLNEATFQELMVGLETFREEVAYVLNNADIDAEGSFAFFKNLSFVLHFTQGTAGLDYDSVKRLSGFYWQILSGWDWVTGYPKEDPISKMIRDI